MPFSETAFYYGFSQMARLMQPNGNCRCQLSWTNCRNELMHLPHQRMLLFFVGPSYFCTARLCFALNHQASEVSAETLHYLDGVTVWGQEDGYRITNKWTLTLHSTQETFLTDTVIRTASLEQFHLGGFARGHLRSITILTKLHYLSCTYLETTSYIHATSHFHNCNSLCGTGKFNKIEQNYRAMQLPSMATAKARFKSSY